MTLILHLSDTHFGSERPPVVEALLRLAKRAEPDIAILSGDITQRARSAEFSAARQFVDALGIPARVVLPGNHDIPLLNLPIRLLSPYSRYCRAFGSELEPELETDGLLIIGVNTTRWYRHKDGIVSGAQIERVSERLRRAAPRALKIVVTHQPIHVTRTADEHNLLHGHRAAAEAWSDAGADLVLGGHIHLPYVRELGAHIDTLKRRLWSVQAGTAVSTRVRASVPNSVNLIRHPVDDDAARCTIERWDFNADSGEFGVADSTAIALDRPAV